MLATPVHLLVGCIEALPVEASLFSLVVLLGLCFEWGAAASLGVCLQGLVGWST